MVCIVEGDFHEPKFTGIDEVRYGIVQPGFLVDEMIAFESSLASELLHRTLEDEFDASMGSLG